MLDMTMSMSCVCLVLLVFCQGYCQALRESHIVEKKETAEGETASHASKPVSAIMIYLSEVTCVAW